jgi:hypothetical protein
VALALKRMGLSVSKSLPAKMMRLMAIIPRHSETELSKNENQGFA